MAPFCVFDQFFLCVGLSFADLLSGGLLRVAPDAAAPAPCLDRSDDVHHWEEVHHLLKPIMLVGCLLQKQCILSARMNNVLLFTPLVNFHRYQHR